jgi:hypothetical protein
MRESDPSPAFPRSLLFRREQKGKAEKEELLQTFIALHGALFGLRPEQARESAEYRLLATNTVDLITSKTSTDVEGDWIKLEAYLQMAYASIVREMPQSEQRPS